MALSCGRWMEPPWSEAAYLPMPAAGALPTGVPACLGCGRSRDVLEQCSLPIHQGGLDIGPLLLLSSMAHFVPSKGRGQLLVGGRNSQVLGVPESCSWPSGV